MKEKKQLTSSWQWYCPNCDELATQVGAGEDVVHYWCENCDDGFDIEDEVILNYFKSIGRDQKIDEILDDDLSNNDLSKTQTDPEL